MSSTYNYKVGSPCEIYSNSKRKWFKGEVTEIFNYQNQTYLTIKFGEYKKQIPISSNEVRPILQQQQKATEQKHEEHKIIQKTKSPKRTSFKLTWQHISNAIAHELYDKLASQIMVITQKDNIKDEHIFNPGKVDIMFKQLQHKLNIDTKEIDYINGLIERAKVFEPLSASKNVHPNKEEKNVAKKQSTINRLFDIYSTHNCFLFGNYHFTTYSQSEFMDDLKDCKYIDMDPNYYISSLKSNIIDLYPKYIIDDDMFIICRYFFAASYVVHKLTEINGLSAKFALNIFIMCRRIVSIYDNNITYSSDINSLCDHNYIIRKGCVPYSQLILAPDDYTNAVSIGQMIENHILALQNIPGGKRNFAIIIDRRNSVTDNVDKLYVTAFDKEHLFNDLLGNYTLALQFHSHINTICHFYYGEFAADRIRFYPEYLTTIIPRFFKKNKKLNYYKNIEKIYADN
eukprot:171200_1